MGTEEIDGVAEGVEDGCAGIAGFEILNCFFNGRCVGDGVGGERQYWFGGAAEGNNGDLVGNIAGHGFDEGREVLVAVEVMSGGSAGLDGDD